MKFYKIKETINVRNRNGIRRYYFAGIKIWEKKFNVLMIEVWDKGTTV